MGDQIGFRFPVDTSQQFDGFNDAGIEHFSGSPYSAFGREVTQNVVDAREGEAPAKIVVKLISIDTASIPNVDELRSALTTCKDTADTQGDKAQDFFNRAVDVISQPKINVLQVADFNTTGLAGPCVLGTPYFALLKAPGQSPKADDASIGTFGLGKYAPFVVSDLRTVFVTTVWADGENWHHYVQGKSILMSHPDAQGELCRGTGFWGFKTKCLPITDLSIPLPKWLVRTAKEGDLPEVKGTTISILGFEPIKGWQHRLAANIAENFFGAIVRERLEVEIDGKVILNKHTIHDAFNDEEMRNSIVDMMDEPDRFDHSKVYLEAVSPGDHVKPEDTENQHLGRCELRLIVREGLPKKIAVLRDGMLITEDFQGLKRFGDFKDFAGVLECHSLKGNMLLKKMEPPNHDGFFIERLKPQDRSKGRIAVREIADWVRRMLRRHAQDEVKEISTVDELKEFFWDEAEEGSEGRDGEEDPRGKINIRLRALRRKDRAVVFEREAAADDDGGLEGDDPGAENGGDDEGEHGGGGSGDGGEGGTGGPDEGDGEGSGGGSSGGGGTKNVPAKVRLRDVRSIPLTRKTRRIAFTPDFSGDIRILVQDSGADSNHALQIVSASIGSVAQGRVDGIPVTEGSRCSLEIELSADFDGAMRVVADAV